MAKKSTTTNSNSVECPVCHQSFHTRGIYPHVRSQHPEYKGTLLGMRRDPDVFTRTPRITHVAEQELDVTQFTHRVHDLAHALMDVELGVRTLSDGDIKALGKLRSMIHALEETPKMHPKTSGHNTTSVAA